MPGHYVPVGGLSRNSTGAESNAISEKLDAKAPKWLNSLAGAELPLICFLRARIVLIKGLREPSFTLLFILNQRQYENRASRETVIATKEKT